MRRAGQRAACSQAGALPPAWAPPCPQPAAHPAAVVVAAAVGAEAVGGIQGNGGGAHVAVGVARAALVLAAALVQAGIQPDSS